jgi:FKBP-type peptidyl-prolyl cis-trans isomerase SlpA
VNRESELAIEQGSLVEMHFSLALESGELIDSNFAGKPARFRIGDGNVLPGFEETLLGLETGMEAEKLIPAEQAFGLVNPDNRQTFPIAKFQHLLDDDLIPTEIGSVVSFRDPGGGELPGVIASIDEHRVVVDFNHPLAGKSILFRAKILSVVAADVEAVSIKLS